MAENFSYILSCCSTADTSVEYFAEKDIKFACFHYYMDDVAYTDDFYQSMDPHDFYQKMTDGAMTRTSQINADEFINYFKPFLEQGLDILHLTLSSGISGVLNSAQIAAEELRDEFPDRKITIVDSLTASGGFGLYMDQLAKLRDQGMSYDDIVKWTLDHRMNNNTWFFSTDLTFYVRGGRISKASGWFGTALNICPLLNVNCEGKLIPRTKCRGKKLVKKAIVNAMLENCEDGADYSKNVFITHSDCIEDANDVADLIRETFPKMSEEIRIFNIGTTIGSHTGPGTVCIAFWGQEKGQ